MNPITKMMKRCIKMPLRKALPLLFVSAVLLISITGCVDSTSSNSPSPAAAVASATPTAQKASPTPTATPKVTATPAATQAKAAPTQSGQGTASNSDWSLTARNQGTYYSTNQFEQPDPGNKYVQIYIELTNKGAKNALMGNQFQFKLFDNQNIGHQAATASFGNANSLQSIQNSNSGDKVAGTIIFEMPSGNTPTKLVYEPGLFSSSLTVTL